MSPHSKQGKKIGPSSKAFASTVFATPDVPPSAKDAGQSPSILFRERHCLVAYKPARMLTMGDKTGDPHLLDWVKDHEARLQKAGTKGFVAPVHFLDRPVSGAVLFALSSKGAARLAAQFRDRTIDKRYVVLVENRPDLRQGPLSPLSLSDAAASVPQVLVDWLAKDPKTNLVKVVHHRPLGSAGTADVTPGTSPQRCELTCRLLDSLGDYRLIEVKLGTGRSHQIRVQLASRGWPVVGDLKYGSQTALKTSGSSHGAIALHAYSLVFQLPVGGAETRVIAPIPSYWYPFFPAGRLDQVCRLVGSQLSPKE